MRTREEIDLEYRNGVTIYGDRALKLKVLKLEVKALELRLVELQNEPALSPLAPATPGDFPTPAQIDKVVTQLKKGTNGKGKAAQADKNPPTPSA